MTAPTGNAADQDAGSARGRLADFVDDARGRSAIAAERVRAGKQPLRRLSDLGREFAEISHRATSRVLESQTRLLEHQLDALAGHLQAASDADTLSGLVRAQFRLIPEDASRLWGDSRETLSAVAEAGGELRRLIADTVSDLRDGGQPDRPPAASAPGPVGERAGGTKSGHQDSPSKRTKSATKKARVRKKSPARAPQKSGEPAKSAARKATAERSSTAPTAPAGKPDKD